MDGGLSPNSFRASQMSPTVDEAMTWRTIRLEALANAPVAFGPNAGGRGKGDNRRLSEDRVRAVSTVCRL
jgi:hypothetical protein